MINFFQLDKVIEAHNVVYTYHGIPMNGHANFSSLSSAKVHFEHGRVTKITSDKQITWSTKFKIEPNPLSPHTPKLIKVNHVLLALEEARNNKIISKEAYMYIILSASP